MTELNLITSEQVQAVGGQARRFKSGLLYMIDLKSADNTIDDQWLEKLHGQSKLVELYLQGTAITDRAVELLRTLTSLETLDLSETAITDKSLDTLGEMHHLTVLGLTGTNVSQEKVREIRASMINTRIIHID